ncbi:MAG: cell division protein ZapA [Azospirillum sp.]|nr:cell division protein ZapA [Azospirillum sp.]
MARVEITLNGRKYPMACEPGQEGRVGELANYIESRLTTLTTSGVASSEAHLLAMVAILLADELFDVTAEIKRLRTQAGPHEADDAMVANVDRLARRIEDIAARLERA